MKILFLEKDKVQEVSINHLKLEVHESNNKDEKITTNFEASNPEEVLRKGYPGGKLSKIEGQNSYIEKH